MTNNERKNIIGCMRTVVLTAGQGTQAHRDLARNTMVVVGALDLLFQKEGLEPIGNLFSADIKLES